MQRVYVCVHEESLEDYCSNDMDQNASITLHLKAYFNQLAPFISGQVICSRREWQLFQFQSVKNTLKIKHSIQNIDFKLDKQLCIDAIYLNVSQQRQMRILHSVRQMLELARSFTNASVSFTDAFRPDRYKSFPSIKIPPVNISLCYS